LQQRRETSEVTATSCASSCVSSNERGSSGGQIKLGSRWLGEKLQTGLHLLEAMMLGRTRSQLGDMNDCRCLAQNGLGGTTEYIRVSRHQGDFHCSFEKCHCGGFGRARSRALFSSGSVTGRLVSQKAPARIPAPRCSR